MAERHRKLLDARASGRVSGKGRPPKGGFSVDGQDSRIQSQGLAHRPRLKRTTARQMRWVALGDLGQVPAPEGIHELKKRRQEALPGFETRFW